jgi:predicted small integral membrane protein
MERPVPQPAAAFQWVGGVGIAIANSVRAAGRLRAAAIAHIIVTKVSDPWTVTYLSSQSCWFPLIRDPWNLAQSE